MRNILAHLPAKGKALFAEKLKQIWLQPDLESAKAYANSLMDAYESQYPSAVEVLETGLEDSLQFYNFKQIDHRKISSTNMLERLNREIRRRTAVVGIFPSIDSYIRLVTTYLIEYGEEWSTGRSYIKPEIIQSIQEEQKKAA
jgi:transposase-like protein